MVSMDDEMTYETGDVVILNSGGPRMTVVGIAEDGGVACVWMNEDAEELHQGVFKAATIELASR